MSKQSEKIQELIAKRAEARLGGGEKAIEKLIESALEEAKKAWGTNGNLAAYIEPEYVIRMTPAEADEIAAKLNAEPGTIVTLEEK